MIEAALVVGEIGIIGAEELWSGRLISAGFSPSRRAFIYNLLADDSWLSLLSRRRFFQNFVTDAREDAAQELIVILRPAVEGMIMALGALKARAQK